MIFYILHQNIPDINLLIKDLKYPDNAFIYKPATTTLDDIASAYNKFISNTAEDKTSITLLFIYKNSHEYNVIQPFDYVNILSQLSTIYKPAIVNIISEQYNPTDSLKAKLDELQLPLLYSTKSFYKLSEYVITSSYLNGNVNTLEVNPKTLYFNDEMFYNNYLGQGTGYSHNAFINKLDNKLYTCGNNEFNQLGKISNSNVSFSDGIVQGGSCGNAHTAVIVKKDDKNMLLTFGDNTFGQLGTKDENGYVVLDGNPVYVSCGYSHTGVIVDKNGTRSLVLFGDNSSGQCDTSKITDNIIYVDCGYSHTAVLTEKFSTLKLTVIGNNDKGQLGDNFYKLKSKAEIPVAVSCGYSHTAIITDKDGVRSLYMFGDNTLGQLGNIDQNNKVKDLIPVKVVCGHNHTAVIATKDGVNSLYTFGSNEFGQLGIKYNIGSFTSTPEQVIIEGIPKNVVCGGSHTVVLTEDNKLYVFGSNKYGELGVINNLNTFIPTFIPTQLTIDGVTEISNISAGTSHTAIVGINNGVKQLYTFGNNDFGQLKRSTFDKAVDLEGTPVSVAWGKTHTAVIVNVNNKNRLYTFGDDKFGQLGKQIIEENKNNNCTLVACGKYHTVAVFNNNKLVGFGNNDYGQVNLPAIRENILSIACGSYHSAIITTTNRVYLVGSNKHGQCQLIPPNKFDGKPISVACGDSHTVILTDKKKVHIFGNNEQKQLNLPINDNIAKISCGYFHTALLTTDNKLYTFGDNTYNQLIPSEYQFDGKIVDVVCGDYYTLVSVQKDGLTILYGIGANWYGQLGFDPIKFNVITTPTLICYTNFDNTIYNKLDYNNDIISYKFTGDANVKVFNYQAGAKFITKKDNTTISDYTITDDSLYKKAVELDVSNSYILSYNDPRVVVLANIKSSCNQLQLSSQEINVDEINIDNLKDVVTLANTDKVYLNWFITTYNIDKEQKAQNDATAMNISISENVDTNVTTTDTTQPVENKSRVQKMLSKVENATSNMINNASKIMSKAKDGLKAKVTSAAKTEEKIEEAVIPVLEQVDETINKIEKEIKQDIPVIETKVVEAVKPIVNQISKPVTNITNNIKKEAQNLSNNATKLATKAKEEVVETVQEVKETVEKVATKAKEEVVETVQEVKQTVEKVATKAKEEVVETVQEVKTVAKNTVNNINQRKQTANNSRRILRNVYRM